MRIARFLFTSLIIVAIIAVIGGIIVREALLLWGTSTVRSSVTELQSISRNATEYVRLCRQKGTPSDQVAIDRLQIRFTSSHEYVMEVLCAQFLLDPIVIRSQELPPFVTKAPGSAGIIWGEDRSGVTIEAFGRKRSVIVEGRKLTGAPANTDLGTFPVSSCGGYGYMCCQEETQSGVGQPFTQVNDCPKSCYQQCIVRPIILSFASDPYPEVQTRAVGVIPGTNVLFSYVANYEAKTPVQVVIDYGDGTKDTLSTLQGETSHTFECVMGKCSFPVTVTAVTATGVKSAETPLTKITVNVAP